VIERAERWRRRLSGEEREVLDAALASWRSCVLSAICHSGHSRPQALLDAKVALSRVATLVAALEAGMVIDHSWDVVASPEHSVL
jgi:hypothetical protein